jgi:alpha-beta hydrolase superfamily lysophospholipase
MSEAPGPIAPTATTTINAPRGALYAETFVPASPKGVVLITHGYAEHCGRYREVAHVITNAGWAALSYDCRGHGQSPGARGYIDRFDVYLDDFAAALAAARALVPTGSKTIALGHSHGGLITLRALCDDRPPEVSHAIISSPFLGLKKPVPGWKKVLARGMSRIAPHFKEKNHIEAVDLTHDLEKQKEHDADRLNFDIATARWFTESSAAQDYVAAHADRIRVPSTWLVGAADPLTDPAVSRIVAGRTPGADYHDLAGMRHEVFNETDRASVFAHVSRVLGSV